MRDGPLRMLAWSLAMSSAQRPGALGPHRRGASPCGATAAVAGGASCAKPTMTEQRSAMGRKRTNPRLFACFDWKVTFITTVTCGMFKTIYHIDLRGRMQLHSRANELQPAWPPGVLIRTFGFLLRELANVK